MNLKVYYKPAPPTPEQIEAEIKVGDWLYDIVLSIQNETNQKKEILKESPEKSISKIVKQADQRSGKTNHQNSL